MSLLPRKTLSKRYRPPASELGYPIGVGGRIPGYMLGPNNTGVHLDEDASLTLPAVFACVNVIARDLSSLPLRLIQRMPDGRRRQATEHPLYRLLKWSPDNGVMPSINWRMTLMLHVLVWGNAYAEVVRDGQGKLYSLEIRDPLCVQPYWDGVNLTYKLDGVTVAKEKILHLRGLSKDGVVGYSPVLAARQAIALGIAGQNFAGSYLHNGLQSSGIVHTPDGMTPEARKELADGIQAMTTGGSAWSLVVMPPGCSWESTSTDPDKAQLLAMRRQALLDACAIFNVPPTRVQVYDHSSYSTLEQSDLQYVRGTLIPWGEIWEQTLGLRLLTPQEQADGFEIVHDYTQLTRGDSAARTNYFRALNQNGVITPNDWAIAEGFEPFEGGDVHTVQMNVVSINDMNQKNVSTSQDAGG